MAGWNEELEKVMDTYFEHEGTDTVVVCPFCEDKHPANQINAGWSGRNSISVVGLCPNICECIPCIAGEGVCENYPER